MRVTIPIETFIISEVNDILWDQSPLTWDAFYSDEYYSKYMQSQFGVTIPTPPNAMLWDHAVLLTIGFPAGYDYPMQQGERKKKKKIKLIFIMENKEQVFEKETKKVKVEFKDHVENVLTEKFGKQVILEDVQIIHR